MKTFSSLIFHLILISICKLCYCQSAYFNNSYHLGNPDEWSGAVTLYSEEYGYIICGKSGNDIGLIKLDISGEELWSKTWGDTASSWYTGYPGCLVHQNTTTNYLAGVKQYFTPTSYGVGLLMKFDSNWDTVFSLAYGDQVEPIDTSMNFDNMAICQNGDLVFTGELYPFQLPSKMILVRTDSIGKIRYFKSFGISGINRGYSVIETTDFGFAIGGFWYIPGDQIATGDPIIIKTDSLGNQQWIKNLGGPIVDNRAMLCKANEGNILMGTTIADSLTGGNSTYSRINVVKMDNEGTIIWNKKFGESSFSNFLSNIRCLEDSSIICTGSVWTDVPGRVGWVMKLNSEGDSMWYRQYYLLNGESSLNYLGDIVQVSDSGYVACGYISPISPDTGIQSAWVIKLDSIGCDSAGCDTTVGVNEHGGMEAWGHGELEIWPNPARDWISLRLPDNLSTGAIEVAIYNIFGQEVMKISVNLQNRAVSLNVTNLPSGFYLAVCKDIKRKVFKGKFVVAH